MVFPNQCSSFLEAQAVDNSMTVSHEDAQDSSRSDKKAVRVEIYVAEHCFTCEYAREIADLIERDFSEVELQVIDINSEDHEIPEAVFATPTYLLNGRVWSLGNPYPEQVKERLTELLENEN